MKAEHSITIVVPKFRALLWLSGIFSILSAVVEWEKYSMKVQW